MATAKAHTNIALVKYWGKKDQELIIPQTDSLSLTLNEFYTTTTVSFDNHLTSDLVAIDQQTLSKQAAKKVIHVLDIVRQLSGIKAFARVESINHVPTAAGLASSASAFAALAGAASAAAGLNLSGRDLSRLARRGSGSATRSIYGGLVEWQKGTDDTSSFAQPILENVDFPIEMLAVLVDTKKKKVSSRSGMQSSVETSPYYDAWRQVVANDMIAIKQAIKAKDIDQIGHIAEENALRMHALTFSADPGFTYFNGETLTIIKAVEDLRNQGVNCYYTMDAGPNVKVIYDRGNRSKIVEELSNIVGPERLVVSQPGPGIKIWNE
ncbi:diphosphomevalonate decarboxylase [Limosilactobacillus reuteri]|jgi:diphosphomevalonate decarboxylase|uniref:diphosphomevalonate decarboxylase n=1 Tax=Limosilactobacillus reuteri TaxID=1598 RepID=A0A4S2E704_LIMRT|nr:diphosphomevalonate decarboxylase [Limosilactobacillus reuteri]MCC4331676.1 diphosphomevalonate decarboxylase [Limosilactobacillus reuteri]MCC4354402.1 diphosphomevalonate decarboxylase [Limosilactobacillus reuteri]MCC4469914.1 diphosphomevalonate decarboxylase [Limosilactobacillus reuteri]QDR72547.1 diphosphomevalonate decarboxylase [Limosilactobacillus reuteri]TGY49784.1 diphosphomevalonate decarboxylase [Limosilactobacillus reuteri]